VSVGSLHCVGTVGRAGRARRARPEETHRRKKMRQKTVENGGKLSKRPFVVAV
jgi:hypothetical protein